MLFVIDTIIIIFILIIVLMVLSGIFSLCERKVLAIFQLRIGPALLLFGILTPITDGIKLFLKFILLIINFDILHFCIAMFITVICMYFIWFLFPIGYILMQDTNFTLLLLLAIHVTSNIFSVFVIGCLIFSSCFIYLAAMRGLFFTILSEATLNVMIYIFYILNYFSFLTIKTIAIDQIYINNIYIIGILLLIIIIIIILLDTLRIPFDYLECESELVAGIVTEFSGFFFIIYSLLEINHIIINSILLTTLIFGGAFLSLKSIFILFIVFLIPRAISARIKITTAQTFIILFLYTITFLYLLWISITKALLLLI